MTGVRPQSGMSGLIVRCCYRHWRPSCMRHKGSVLDTALDRRASWFPNRWCIYSVSLHQVSDCGDQEHVITCSHQKDAVDEGERRRPASVAPRRERAVEQCVGQAGSHVMAGWMQHRAPNPRARSPDSHPGPRVSSGDLPQGPATAHRLVLGGTPVLPRAGPSASRRPRRPEGQVGPARESQRPAAAVEIPRADVPPAWLRDALPAG